MLKIDIQEKAVNEVIEKKQIKVIKHKNVIALKPKKNYNKVVSPRKLKAEMKRTIVYNLLRYWNQEELEQYANNNNLGKANVLDVKIDYLKKHLGFFKKNEIKWYFNRIFKEFSAFVNNETEVVGNKIIYKKNEKQEEHEEKEKKLTKKK